ncbi:phage tail protein [Streptococcus suis]|uniref:phage tail protein n=1 Tax=Streptococcus suis TaxID=1307 RepID=UPI001ABE7D83|nr:phage tail protein [Streptococcus suis]
MATDLGSAYVQIVPSAKGISGSISKILDGEVGSAGKSAGIFLGGALKTGILAVLGAGALGLGAILKNAIPAGADLQQSFGGLDTIYDGAQESAKNFAKEAYKAGISANTYAEQAVSMGASLKQALGGDSTKAINMANMAIMDMTDNAAKMGTDIGVIQQTYQSLARGNYAMLDNLKLGFGGTKAEMERLLTTAEGLPSAMGRKFDISNYADVVEAIHLVQENMGLTGVAAAEAENTYTGSLAAMKASWANSLAGLSLGENIAPQLQALATTTSNFLFGNFIPMVGNIFKGLPSAIGTFIAEASPLVAQQFQGMFSSLGMSVDLSPITSKFQEILTAFQPVIAGIQTAFGQLPGFFSTIGAAIEPVITTIMDGIARLDFSGIQTLIEAILPAVENGFQRFMEIVSPAIETVVDSFVNMWNAAQPLISILSEALMPAFDIFGSFLGGVVKGILEGVSFAFDALKVAIELLTPVVDFLVQAFNFIQPVLSVIAEWIGVAIGMFGNLGSAGEGLSSFIKSAWTNIQSAIQTAGNIIRTVIDWIKLAFSGAGNAVGVLKNAFSLAWMAIQDVVKVAKGIIDNVISGIKGAFKSFEGVVSSVGGAVRGVIDKVISTIKGIAKIDISGAGAAIMNGFLGGLKSAWEGVKSFVGGIAGWIAKHKGPISYDRVLLKPAGLAIMQGLNTNLKVGFKDVMGTVSGMAGAIAKPFENQSLAYDVTSSASVDVRRNLLSSSGDLAGNDGGNSLAARLANIERFLSALVDKELAVYLDGEKMAQNSYMHQGAIMAREGI